MPVSHPFLILKSTFNNEFQSDIRFADEFQSIETSVKKISERYVYVISFTLNDLRFYSFFNIHISNQSSNLYFFLNT